MAAAPIRRASACLLAGFTLLTALPAAADHNSFHYNYWRRELDRWSPQRWDHRERHNHWSRPCGGLGCDPASWGPSWVRPCGGLGCDPRTWSWGGSRPWRHGWFDNWYYRNWGWWGSQAALWGVEALATAAVIDAAVNSAIQANSDTINVPGSSYELDYGSVRAGSENGINFVVRRDGQSYLMGADCQDGELNGHAPTTAAEAQLLNAACQVA
ncbi:MAG: hypothetical protein ACKO50_13045, partial [Cyanobium sp.]